MKNINYTVFFILLLWQTTFFAQNYRITYGLVQVAKSINLTTTIKTYLTGNGVNSLYIEDYRNSVEKNTGDNDIIKMPGEQNPKYYKDLQKNTVICVDQIRFEFFNIFDNVGKFDWKITPDTKTILGYNCQRANLKFRGRDFVVYFTSDISIPDGPIKFSGLPGLILEVYTDNSELSYDYKVQKIELNLKEITITNPFANQEIIPYTEYVKKYREKYDESLHKIINDRGETRPISKGYMEIFIE